jgi:hypothetical protein
LLLLWVLIFESPQDRWLIVIAVVGFDEPTIQFQYIGSTSLKGLLMMVVFDDVCVSAVM